MILTTERSPQTRTKFAEISKMISHLLSHSSAVKGLYSFLQLFFKRALDMRRVGLLSSHIQQARVE